MKRVFLLIIFTLLTFSLYAQTSCYNETRSRGISFYNKGQYENAIKAFTAAKSCPDKPKNNDLDSWISKCKSKPTPVPTPTPTPTPTPAKTDTYIKIDGKSSTTSTKSSDGGTETFNVSTDAKSWTTWGVPSWCSIENKTSSSFRLRVNANTSTSERSDYMEVRTPNGHSARINIKQSGKANTNKADIENVTVSHDETVNGESGMKINMKLTISEKKGKNCSVVAYFYDESGNKLKDSNNKYSTKEGSVCAFKDITPSYESSEWKSLSITIPYSELHLPSSGSKTVKFHLVVWDESVSPNESLFRSESYSTSFYYTNSYLKVDGSSSDKTKRFSESGGRERYTVDTSDSSFETWGVPSWCSIENQTSSSFTLVCNRNTSTSSRSDYMKVKAAGKEIRIDITQDASSGPSAKIVSVSQEHNVSNGFSRGMNIKLKFETSGMLNKRVTATAWFYYADNTTKLNNGFGGQVNVSKSDTAPYEDTTFTMTLFLPYTNLRMMGSGSTTLTFDVVITDSSGKTLARDENNSFTYSQGW